MWLPKEGQNNDNIRYNNDKEGISKGPKPSEKL